MWITPEALAQWMGRYKALIGPRLRARHPDAQQTEPAIGVAVRNRMLAAARPIAARFPQHSPWGKRYIAHTVASMHQRHALPTEPLVAALGAQDRSSAAA